MAKDSNLPNFSNKEGEIILSSAYMAPISYYKMLTGSDQVCMESMESYQKQSYRNRCNIAAANGMMTLSIPVESRGGEKVPIKDVKISRHNDWQIQHWRSLTSAYQSTPFFEYFEDDIRPVYEKKWVFLWDFNWEIMQKILHLLDFKPNILIAEKYRMTKGENDYRDKIHPKKESIVECATYYQVFEHKYGFLPDLSIIDLLFNMGNEAILILNKTTFKK